jgi:hypothetical protein
MKKIVVSLLVLFSAFSVFAQPITRRAMDVNTVSDARLQAQYNLFLPRYTDTTAANLSKGIDSCGAAIFTYDNNTQWIRACNPKRWVKAAGSVVTDNTQTVNLSGDGSTATPLTADVNLSTTGQNAIVALADGLYVPNSVRNGLVWGGAVTWISGYTYSVAEAFYYINGAPFHSPTTTITLDPSDNDSSRIDLIVVNNQNLVGVVKGSLSTAPLEPTIDPSSQLRLSIVLVQAGTAEPTNNGTGLRRECIYQENTEWTTASSSARINPNSINAPCVGTKDVEGTGVLNGDYVRFTRPSGNITILDSFQVLTFQLKSKAVWGNNRKLILRWQNSGVNVGGVVNLSGTSYGWSSNLTGVCQTISIPLADFGLPVGASVNQLLITAFMPNGSIGFYLDQMCLQNQQQPSYATPMTLQNGLNLDANTNIGELGGTLLHNTTNNTAYYVHTLSGISVYNYPYQFQQGQNFGNSTGITSFLSSGAVVPASPDYQNQVRLGVNYTSDIYQASPLIEGYFGDRIGYMLNTNLRGHGSYGMYQDDYKAKNVGIFFHTRDNIYKDGVTIFAGDSSNVAGDYSGLKNHKVAIFKTDKTVQFPGYPSSRNDGVLTKALGTDIDGNLILGTVSGGGSGGTDNANAGSGYRILMPATQEVKTLFNGYAIKIDSSSNTNGLTFKADTALLTTNAHLYKVVDSLPRLTAITADNGLTANTSSNVQLGGTLLQNTTINSGSFQTLWTGSTSNYILGVTNNSTGAAFVINNNSSGTGLQSYSDHGLALYGLTAGSTTSGIDRVLLIEKGNAGAGLNGNGVSMEFAVKTSLNSRTTTKLVSKLSDATDASYTSQFEIYGVNNTTTARKLAIAGNGKLTLDGYGAGTQTGTATYGLAVDASGNVIERAMGITGITADNGLTASTSTNVQLGGTLSANTTIAAGTFFLQFTGTNSGGIIRASSTSGAGASSAISGSGTSGSGISGTSSTGSGGVFSSTSGYGLYAQSTSGVGAKVVVFPSSTNTVIPVIELQRVTSGTAANGIGGSIDFMSQIDNGSLATSNQIISKWTNVAALSRTSQFEIWGVNSAVNAVKFIVKANGIINIPTAPPSYANNAAAISGGLSVGDLYLNGDALQIVH